MVHCIVVGCSNRTPRDSRKGISFLRLSLKDKALLNKWLVPIKRENLPQLKHSHVCSEHFEPTCFESEYRLDLLPGNSSRCRLKEDAIPTLFPHKNNLCKRPASERRRSRARHEEVSHTIQSTMSACKLIMTHLTFRKPGILFLKLSSVMLKFKTNHLSHRLLIKWWIPVMLLHKSANRRCKPYFPFQTEMS